ncbi:MAG: GntR family transcriptional regulator [Caulobacteraceae bacterium]
MLDTLAVHGTGVPIYVQLRDQLLRAIGSGQLAADEQMPTMRQVAVAMRVDLNTVRRAYDELERLGAISLIRGRGSFVSGQVVPIEPPVLALRTDEIAKHTLTAAAAAGVDPRAVAERILTLLEQGGAEP